MLKTLGVVQVREDPRSRQLRVARRLGGMSLLEQVVRRVTDCARLDGVVVLGHAAHRELIRPLVPPDVPVLASDASDGLAQFAAVLDEHPAHCVVRVCCENPFIDPVLIDRLVSTADAHPHCDYISYCCADGRPVILTQLGMFAEWCGAPALRRAHREARRPEEREAVTGYLYAHPEQFSVRLIPVPPELDRDDLRFQIDSEEDWEHAQVIHEALGAHEWDWQRIADLLDHQPALRKRMAVLNRAMT